MERFRFEGIIGPRNDLGYETGRIEGRGRFKDDTDLFAVFVERRDAIGGGFILPAGVSVLFAVL